jgi:hypothetical protein
MRQTNGGKRLFLCVWVWKLILVRKRGKQGKVVVTEEEHKQETVVGWRRRLAGTRVRGDGDVADT